MSTVTMSQLQRDGDAILASAERIRRREEAALLKPIPARYADVTPDQLRSQLFEEWRDRGGDFVNMEVALTHVEAALEALDGDDQEARRGAAVVLTLAYLDHFGVAAYKSLKPWLAKVIAHAQEAIGVYDDTAALVGKVEAAIKGKGASAEDILVAVAASGDSARFIHSYRIGAQEVNDAAVKAANALASYRNYLPRLEEIEARAGTLQVPRLTPAALKALEAVSRLTATDWSKERRAAAVETLRSLVAAFGGTHWCQPSEFPQEAATPEKQPRRGGVFAKLGIGA